MGRRAIASPAHLSSAEKDILRAFPEASIKWDTGMAPHMVSIVINGALIRAFVEPEVLAERGDIYVAFSRRIMELIEASIPKAAGPKSPSFTKDGRFAGTGPRAPLSAAKVSSRLVTQTGKRK
jgi:hypothetical protein